MKIFKFFFVLLILFCFQNFPQENNVKQFKKDWSHAIDSIWGPGLPTENKLQVFDFWWNKIDQTWGGFPNIEDKWDSLKNFYRPIIANGVSHGRFHGILGRLTRYLKEAHSFIGNMGIDSTFGIYENENPYYPSFHYTPGIPALHLTALINRNYFGAGVTAYNDSIALVYSAIPNHPLGLQPGDIILGYDGIPWRENLQALLNQELPLIYGGAYMGSTDESVKHIQTSSVGLNWGLFNTIDILKYSTGDTVHFPTSLMNSITWPYPVTIPLSEQLPVNGVPFNNYLQGNHTPIIWGVIEGTSIGYIYVYHWSNNLAPVQVLFRNAVDSLMHIKNVTGLILDFRSNGGGHDYTANDGFKHLFNEDPTPNFCDYIRSEGGEHLDFYKCFTGMMQNTAFTPTSELFDHPLAVLTGPECLSFGDMNSFRMRFHPTVRIFGKGTNGAFVSWDQWYRVPFTFNNYTGMVYTGSVFSNYNNEGYMVHKGNPIHEKIWLTPDAVANGRDNVVERAIEWINNKVYPHDITINKWSLSEDTVHITAKIENSNSHQISARGYIHNLNNVLIDSVDLINLEGTWKGNIRTPAEQDFYKVSVSSFDESVTEYFTLPNAKRFTTVPVFIDSMTTVDYPALHYFSVKLYLKNGGIDDTLRNLRIYLQSADSSVVSINPGSSICANILPGQTQPVIKTFNITYDSNYVGNAFNLQARVFCNQWEYWTIDTLGLRPGILGINEPELTLAEFSLEQNYPNPFNPGTTIKYSIPKTSKVQIKIFDVLGKEMETLINEDKQAGTYELNWNANIPSGVYFYQLKAGDFIQTKKMVLMK